MNEIESLQKNVLSLLKERVELYNKIAALELVVKNLTANSMCSPKFPPRCAECPLREICSYQSYKCGYCKAAWRKLQASARSRCMK
jgi:adenine-specific DNA glycosylase